VAANRGIKTSGLYRLVRHPAYAGYLLGYTGYVLCYPTMGNALIAVATLLALNARAIVEERFLLRDQSYRAYLRGTRWRFMPYVY
jgi:protein-S-isoprenylcysteine O-methyltransferase Ste14